MKNLLKVFLSEVGYQIKKTHSSSLLQSYKIQKSFPRDPFEAQSVLIGKPTGEKITIFDVGANKGQTTIKYLSKFPSSRIYCFEPLPELAHKLSTTVTNNENVVIVPKAVSNTNKSTNFYVNHLDVASSLLPRPSSGEKYYPTIAESKEVIQVESITLDSFSQENGLSKVDILKLDIQGGELDALHGSHSLLSDSKVGLIYTEIQFVHLYEGAPLFGDILQYLNNFGYSLFDFYNLHRADGGRLIYGDALFFKNSA